MSDTKRPGHGWIVVKLEFEIHSNQHHLDVEINTLRTTNDLISVCNQKLNEMGYKTHTKNLRIVHKSRVLANSDIIGANFKNDDHSALLI